MKHKCETHIEWLNSVHYMCSCGHVEWAHHGFREWPNRRCAHCNCTQYNGEERPLTEYEKSEYEKANEKQ
jgi:hypothetical protein